MLGNRAIAGFQEEPERGSDLSESLGENPFPGLRPFSQEEWHLFFGREGQVDEILTKLDRHRFVAVMGYSGSGKSSLMYCGLIPVLYGGFMARTGPHWKCVTTRPGTSPMRNLAESLLQGSPQFQNAAEEDRKIHRAIVNSVLQSGTNGLAEVSRFLQSDKEENLFILVDQFEELFRFKDSDAPNALDESLAFVNLILEAVSQSESPVYVAIAMRSDFIGDSAVFHGLADAVNQSNYLVPQMTRDEKRLAVEGPVAVGGGRIAPRLVKKLLSDVGDSQDQLPIMQHAMMRTWDYWAANHDPGEPMDLRHYNAVGGVGQALSQHANEAYDELSARDKEIAEVLFKSITERNQEDQGLRRPCRLGLIAELAEAGEADVIRVVEHFRRPGRSFLMPGTHVPLSANTMIELSHESLMRIWNRLKAWVDEEFESATMYKRLSDAAAMYQIGRTGLWRPPDLQLALNWQKKQRPTRTWAERYDVAFERAIVFLDTSRITYEAELRNAELLQKRMLRRARIFNIILAIAALIAILFFVFALLQSVEATSNLAIANEQRLEAENARRAAEEAQRLAEDRARTIEKQREELRATLQQLQKSNADLAAALEEAKIARAEAERNLNIARMERDTATQERARAEENYIRAEENYQRAQQLLFLTVAQNLAVKSVPQEDIMLGGLEAMQGYGFHTLYEGKKHDPYIYTGLYRAIDKIEGKVHYAVNIPGNLKNNMKSIVVAQTTGRYYTTGNDGRIFWGVAGAADPPVELARNAFPNRVLRLSIDETRLVNASDSSFLQVYNLERPADKPLVIRGHRGYVNDIAFLPDNSGFISAGRDRSLRLNDHQSGKSRQLLAMPSEIKSIAISPDGKTLIGGTWDGLLYEVDLAANKQRVILEDSVRINSISFHPDGKRVLYGVEERWDNRGHIVIYDLTAHKISKELGGFRSGVQAVDISDDGQLVVGASLDQRLMMWVLDHPDDLPVQMDIESGYVWDVTFANNSSLLLSACRDGQLRIWPTDTKALADRLCPLLERNMSADEWETHVGNNIPYQVTCESLKQKDF
jgi:hypothetical protein